MDQLEGTKREGTTVDQFIRSQMEEVLKVVNKYLGTLDNGGYKVTSQLVWFLWAFRWF